MALAIPMMAEAAEWRTDLGEANGSSIGMETSQADGSASGRASASFEAPVGNVDPNPNGIVPLQRTMRG